MSDTPQRFSGVLAHPTCLPGPFQCGELGKETFTFLKLLRDAGQTVWQVLPLNPTDCAPYSSISAFAMNPVLISPRQMVDFGVADNQWLKLMENEFSILMCDKAKEANKSVFFDSATSRHVDFETVSKFKINFFRKAFDQLEASHNPKFIDAFTKFCNENKSWLEPYVAFVVIDKKMQLESGNWRCFSEWAEPYRKYSPKILESLPQKELKFHTFLQFEVWRQWKATTDYAHSLGILVLGDCAIYVSRHSADVWANPEAFDIDQTTLIPRVVSGVPPDYFSEDGQLWGHPVYDWDYLERTNFEWWYQRFRVSLAQVDILRIDHFRGLEAYWAVPYSHAVSKGNARVGEWKQAKGDQMLTLVIKRLFNVSIGQGDKTQETHPILCPGEPKKRRLSEDSSSTHHIIHTEDAHAGVANEDHTMGGSNMSVANGMASSSCSVSSSAPRKMFWPPFVAEDLGVVTPDLKVFLKRFNFPNMKVLEFAFGDWRSAEGSQNPHLPHFYGHNCVAYTGTHDNDTAVGWWEALDSTSKTHFALYSGFESVEELEKCKSGPAWKLVHTTMLSCATLAIVPLQDILLLGSKEGRFNDPGNGSSMTNWRWQLKSLDTLTTDVLDRLENVTTLAGRHPHLSQ